MNVGWWDVSKKLADLLCFFKGVFTTLIFEKRNLEIGEDYLSK